VEERTQDYRLVTTAKDLAAVAKTLQSAEAIGVDIETTALSPRDGGMRLLQLATSKETFVIDAFEISDLSPLTEVLEGGTVKVGHNLKFDYQFLHAIYGLSLSPLFDTMLAAQVLDGGNYAVSYSLEAVVERYLDESLDKSEQRSDWSGELSEAQLEYAAQDASVLLPLRDRLAASLEGEARTDLAHRVRGSRGDSRDGTRRHQARRRSLEGARGDSARATRPGRRPPGVLLPAT
jgi:DNA polymerase-1